MQNNEDDGLTTVRVVFEKYNGNFRAHTIDWAFKNAADQNKAQDNWLLSQRGHTFRDFQEAIMWSLGKTGISGACVRFDSIENSEFAPKEIEPAQGQAPIFETLEAA